MKRALPLICGSALLVMFGAGVMRAPRAEEVPGPQCAAPPELVYDDPKLALTSERLHAKKPLTIVVIGGASTAGVAAGDGATYGYPQRLQEALAARHPGETITVINKGVPRQTTEEMVRRFKTDVLSEHPALVIWETGTVDAVRGVDVDVFSAAVANGIAALRQEKLDVLLVNMQYNSSTSSIINFDPYLDALAHAADIEDVYLFKRYEIMKYWSDNGIFDFVDVARDQRTAFAQRVYRCLGERLAEAVDHGAE